MPEGIDAALRAQVGIGARLKVILTIVSMETLALLARSAGKALAAAIAPTIPTRTVAVTTTRAVVVATRTLRLPLVGVEATLGVCRQGFAVFIQHALTRLCLLSIGTRATSTGAPWFGTAGRAG